MIQNAQEHLPRSYGFEWGAAYSAQQCECCGDDARESSLEGRNSVTTCSNAIGIYAKSTNGVVALWTGQKLWL